MSHWVWQVRLLASVRMAACIVALLTACADEHPNTRTVVTDSSGVRITLSPAAGELHVAVDTDPSISLGGADAEGPEQFHDIRGVHVDSVGNIWVAVRGSSELRIFRPDGSHWKTLGRRGDGPGEFRQIRLLGPGRDTGVALWDDGNPRLTLVTGDGEIDSVSTPSSEGNVPRADAALVDDALLVRFPRRIPAGSLAAGAVIGDTSTFFRYDLATHTVAELATVSGPLWFWTGRLQIPVPFTTHAAVAADRVGALHVSDGADFRIRVIDNGITKESYGVRRPARAVTAEDRKVYRAFFETNLADPELLRAYLSGLDHPALPLQLPAYSQVLIDDSGRTWALIYSPDPLAAGVWDVYGPDRQLLGMAGTPPGLIVNSIAGNRVAGVWRDELGVEHVRLYRFVTDR